MAEGRAAVAKVAEMAGQEGCGMPVWDPEQYARFADHRDRPFHDLLARVGTTEAGRVVDLGCGPGGLTATLCHRWPRAQVVGIDSSAEMIDRARRLTRERLAGGGPVEEGLAGERLTFVCADLRDWLAAAERTAYDVVVSNATLQWVPDHLALLPALVDLLRPGGWLAIQIPGNHDAPLHAILRELATSEPYAGYAAHAADRFSLPGPQDYLAELAGRGYAVDAWETTYLQVLQGPDPVYEWICGTGARPVLQSLPDDLLGQFVREYQARLRQAYPQQGFGTVLPFRRVFAVARRG
ncbi:methyltransferase domain-containing protein [soil metagenome]